jgi:hypothetical protein
MSLVKGSHEQKKKYGCSMYDVYSMDVYLI